MKSADNAAVVPKKSYQKPELRVYGSMAEITGTLGLAGHDGLTGSRLLDGEQQRRPMPRRR
jgi:hypothetical protein